MGRSPEHSPSSSDGSDGNSDGDLFQIGQKFLFSLSSISISSEELEGLSTKEGNEDKHDHREAPNYESGTESETSSSDSQGHGDVKGNSQWRGFLHKLKKGSAMSFDHFHPSLPSLPSIKKISRKKSSSTQNLPALPPALDSQVFSCFEASLKNFSLSEIQNATNNFSHDNLIGEGGYSEVYKGHLQDGKLVAIKRLTRGSPEELTADYLSELGILVHVNHPNIASVIGYGVEGGLHLVLPLSPHGSLASLLNGEKEKLAWVHRYNIAVGTARGLSYLHEGCQRRILHRDIKAFNVLLTEDFEPQISDFGMAKWLPDQWIHLNVSQFEGTFGYLPPEFFLHGTVDEKTDVYAFGVLLLELLSGRPALDKSNNRVVMWAKPFLINKNIEELVDPSLYGAYDAEQVNCMGMVASLCIQQSSSDRPQPQASQMVRMLKGDEGILQSKRKFQKRPALRRRYPVELFTNEEYSPSCVNDGGQHNEVAVEQ